MNAGPIKPRFEPTINWGHIAILAGFVISTAVFYGDVRATLATHDTRIAVVEDVTRNLAAQPERIVRVETQVQGLQRTLDKIDQKLDRLIEGGKP